MTFFKEELITDWDGCPGNTKGVLFWKDDLYTVVFQGFDPRKKLVHFNYDCSSPNLSCIFTHKCSEDYWRKNFISRDNPKAKLIVDKFRKTGIWKPY